jgi:branched-subunit amino acid ABC-type transport system permease component
MALPALNGENVRIVVERTARGPFADSLRIDYRAVEADGSIRLRHVICRFDATMNAQGARPLTGLATEFGPMADASFYFMRRFWLEGGNAVDPAPPAPGASAIPVPRWLALLAQHLLAAAPSAAIYALLAAAYALIYGLIGRIMLVFGEFAALASLAGVAGVALILSLGIETGPPAVMLAVVIGLWVSMLYGAVVGRLVLGPLARAPGQHVLIATVGAGIALSEFLRLAQGPDLRWLPPVLNDPLPVLRAGTFVTTVTPLALVVTMVGGLCVGLLLWTLARSRFGLQWRAVSDDAAMARLFGVDEHLVLMRAVIMGTMMAGLAGLLTTIVHGGFGFAGGFVLGLKALIAAILGGIGSVPGAVLGALLIALFEAVWASALPLDGRDIAVFALLVVILVLKPGGLLGLGGLSPRHV